MVVECKSHNRSTGSTWPGCKSAPRPLLGLVMVVAITMCIAGRRCFEPDTASVTLFGGRPPYNATIELHDSKLASSYAVLNPGSWSRFPWSRNCTSQGGKHLCSLPTTWRNCSQGVYLDIGTNVGVQLRKLYNPEQFPNAPVLPLFNKVFGSNRSRVCAIGVEANPSHTAYLEMLNKYFKLNTFQAVVLTEHAASIKKGSATFHQDSGSPVEWGASLAKGSWQRNGNSTGEVTVALLDLPAFMVQVVRPILLQEEETSGSRPPVVMKLDVEGEEYALLPGMILTGSLCDLDIIFMEAHGVHMRSEHGVNMTIQEIQGTFDKMRKANPLCTVDINNLDDETYRDGKGVPLPS